jgi:ADP-heptose:LPS heptosyltransferase
VNVLLLNLARFGDILQSRAAVSDLVRRGHRVGMVCLENFAPAARLLPGLDHIAPLPGALLLARLKERREGEIFDAARAQAEEFHSGEDRADWPAALAGIADFRRRLRAEFPPDLVCNLTPDASAKVLTRFLAEGGACSGFFVDENGFGVNGDNWAAFFVGSSLERGISPFNVVDMFRRIASDPSGMPGGSEASSAPGDVSLFRPGKKARLEARRLLDEAGRADVKGHVAFQLGASEDRRRWPAAYFAALGDILWREENLLPILLGSANERRLAEEYANLAAHPYLDLCGRTGLAELSAVLCRAGLLVSNDTGTMHLAAGLKVPILAVFLATAQPFDTGPYLAGSCCLEPDLPCHPCAFGSKCAFDLRCARAIRPEFFAALILSRLRGGSWILPETGCGKARVWLSLPDAHGFMDLRSISGHEKERRTLWLALQRRLLRGFLDGKPLVFPASPAPGDAPDDPPLCAGRETTAALNQALALTELLRQQAHLAALPKGAGARQKLAGTWRMVYDALSADPALRALALLFAQTCQGGSGETPDLPRLAETSENFHRLLADFSTALAR